MTDDVTAPSAGPIEWRGHMYAAVVRLVGDVSRTRELLEAFVATPKTAAPDEPARCDREWAGMQCVRTAWHEDDGPHVTITPQGVPIVWDVVSGPPSWCSTLFGGVRCQLPTGHLGPHWRRVGESGETVGDTPALAVGDFHTPTVTGQRCGFAIAVGLATWTCALERDHAGPHVSIDGDGRVSAIWRAPYLACDATRDGLHCALAEGHRGRHEDGRGAVWEDEPEPACGQSCPDRPHLRCSRPRGHGALHEAEGWSW